MEPLHKVRYRWVVLSAYMIVTILSFMSWLTFASIETITETRFQLPNHIVVWLTHIFILSAFLLAIPSGKMIDRWGYKNGVGIGVLLMGIFALFRLLNTHSFLILLISQAGIALGQPIILNGINKLVVSWFPREEHATAIGLGMISIVIGDALALGLTPHLVTHFSFEFMLYVYSIAITVGSLLFMILTKSQPHEIKITENPSIWSEVKEISKFKNYNLSVILYLTSISIIVFFLTYFEKMLNELHGLSATTIGNLSVVFMLFSVIGGIIVPIFSDKAKNRKIFLVSSFILLVPSIILFLYTNNFLWLTVSTSLAGFFLSATQPLIFTISAETLEPKYAGVSVGYLQFTSNGAALFFVPIMAGLRSLSGSFTIPLLAVLLTVFIAIFAAAKIEDTFANDS